MGRLSTGSCVAVLCGTVSLLVQRARQSPVYNPFVDGLDGYNAWNDTALDPAYIPFSLPKHDTLDNSLMESWYTSSHIYSAVFVERLPEFIDGEDVYEYSCDDIHAPLPAHISTDSLEVEQQLSRRMHDAKVKGQGGHYDQYSETMNCIEALRGEMEEGFTWVMLRRFAACAVPLGSWMPPGDDARAVTALQHSMHEAAHGLGHESAPEVSEMGRACPPGAENCSSGLNQGVDFLRVATQICGVVACHCVCFYVKMLRGCVQHVSLAQGIICAGSTLSPRACMLLVWGPGFFTYSEMHQLGHYYCDECQYS